VFESGPCASYALERYWVCEFGDLKKNSGKVQQGGSLIPQDKVEQMIKQKNLLTMGQKKKNERSFNWRTSNN